MGDLECVRHSTSFSVSSTFKTATVKAALRKGEIKNIYCTFSSVAKTHKTSPAQGGLVVKYFLREK